MILLAESGSTKTDWRIIDIQKNDLAIETVGLNPYFLDENQIAEILLKELMPKIEGKITHIYFYGTGITDEYKAETIRNGIKKAFGYEIIIEAYSDILAATHSLFGNKRGIACILGTGSNSCHWNGNKITFQVPPLGFWLGDEGSGGHIGKMLILSYLHKEMPERIRIFFEMHYGKLDRLDVLEAMKDAPNKYFAGFATFVVDNKHEDFIHKLINDSLELFIEKYLSKYPDYQHTEIGFVGSIAFYFKENLIEVAQKYNLHVTNIIQKPINNLVEYYLQRN